MGKLATKLRSAPDLQIPLKEAAVLAGLTADFLRQLIHKQRLAGKHFGHIWTTTPRALKTYLDGRSKKNIPKRYRGRA